MYGAYYDPEYAERFEKPKRRDGEGRTWLLVTLAGALLGIGAAKFQAVFAGTTDVFEQPKAVVARLTVEPRNYGPALPSDSDALRDERADGLPAGTRLVLRGRLAPPKSAR